MSQTDNDKHIQKLLSDISSKRRQTNVRSTLTLLIGVVAIGMMTAYFLFGYIQFQEVTQPATIVNYAKSQFDTNLAKVSKLANEEITKSAPEWAKEISNEVVNYMPDARKQIEDWLKEMLDGQLEEAGHLTTAKFKQMINDNREDFESSIRSLSSESGADQFMTQLVPVLEEEIGADMRQGALEALGIFADLNQRMDRLAAGNNLNEIEQQMRKVLGLVKLLQSENTSATTGG